MSHKTIYIDIDEEITSIVDRLRKVLAREVIVVVPKRALLLQSIVNLKLLKREADRRKKQIMIITQDKIGKKLIEKAGILVQGKIDDETISDNPEIEEYPSSHIRDKDVVQELGGVEPFLDIGSNEYFAESTGQSPESAEKKGPSFPDKSDPKKDDIFIKSIGEREHIEKSENDSVKQKKNSKKVKSARSSGRVRMSDIVTDDSKKKAKELKDKSVMEGDYSEEKAEQEKEEPEKIMTSKADSFFRSPSLSVVSSRKKSKWSGMRINGSLGKYFIFSALLILVVGGVWVAYARFSEASVLLYLKNQEKIISLDVSAETSANEIKSGENIIPAALEQIIKEKSEDFESSGRKTGGGKASGKVVIYNEFSSADQPLVNTTRLETTDGKIFRITKSVVVPGSAKVGTETKPGAIEVDVVADKSGEEYNIDPGTFKIPGFSSSPKYDKIYAKSSKSMTGGTIGETPIVTSGDIADAKEKIVSGAKEEAKKEIMASLPTERKIFEDVIETETISVQSSANAGLESDKFSISAKVRVRALSFAQSDVKDIIRSYFKGQGQNFDQLDFDEPFNFILADSDIQKGFLKFQIKTDVNLFSAPDIENLKKGILGKNSEEIKEYAKNFPAIQKTEVSFWPIFVKKIPMDEKRVQIELKQE